MEQFNQTITPIELADCLGGITVQGVYKALKAHNIPTETNNRRKIIPSEGIRRLLQERGFQYPKLNISFQIVKGGVGKTSLSFCLAIRASHYGARVLVIDLDQQGNLTRSFNVEATREKPVWINLFRDKVPAENAIMRLSDSLHLIPSNLNNSRLDTELTQSSANLKDMIRDIIAPVRNNYDLVIMDCPPAINKINAAATCASDIIIVPINPDPYAMDGLDYTISELNRIKKDFKLSNLDYRVVWNKYDARERLGAVYMHELMKRDDLLNNILPVVCRVDVSLKNAVFDAKTVFEMPKKAPIREDIDQFAKEILGINAWKEKGSAVNQ